MELKLEPVIRYSSTPTADDVRPSFAQFWLNIRTYDQHVKSARLYHEQGACDIVVWLNLFAAVSGVESPLVLHPSTVD